MPRRDPRAERAMLGRQLAQLRYRLQHPDYFVKPGRYTPAQERNLRKKISDLEKQREQVIKKHGLDKR